MVRFTVKKNDNITSVFDNYNEAIENLDNELVKALSNNDTVNLELVFKEQYVIHQVNTRFGRITKFYTKGA